MLWVDDRPSNNAREIEQLKAQGIQVITRTDSDDALADLKSGSPKYDAVITDLKRGFDREAGYKFIDAARSMIGDSMPPVIVYTASTNPNVDFDARKRGAIGGTNSPDPPVRIGQQGAPSANSTERGAGHGVSLLTFAGEVGRKPRLARPGATPASARRPA